MPGLGDVLTGLTQILSEISRAAEVPIAEHAQFVLPGAWEIARRGPHLEDSPIDWQDSGTLRVVNEVPGGTLDPGKMVEALARAAERLGAFIFENMRVEHVRWLDDGGELGFAGGKLRARKILLATNALSLDIAQLKRGMHPKLTLAATTAPIYDGRLEELGLAHRKPFYTNDLPYLWGRVCPNNSIVWGAGLVDPPDGGTLEDVDVSSGDAVRIFASLERRIRRLKPGFEDFTFTHRWGGPILFRENWTPVFSHHPSSRDGIVIGAFAGHGVALSSYLGAWAAEAMLGRRALPPWGRIETG